MKIAIGLLEHLRDALNDVVEGEAPALHGVKWATLEVVEPDPALSFLIPHRFPELRLADDGGHNHARYRASYCQWERLYTCERCEREQWSEYAAWECGCKPAKEGLVEQAKAELEQARAELKRVVQKVNERECAYDNYYTGGYYEHDRLRLAEAENRVKKALCSVAALTR